MVNKMVNYKEVFSIKLLKGVFSKLVLHNSTYNTYNS